MLWAGVAVSVLLLWTVWSVKMAPTNVAFVNYQVIELGEIAAANDNSWVKIKAVGADDITSIGDYDMVLVNGMGLHITEAQREKVERLADEGLPIISFMVTNPDNDFCSLDSLSRAEIKAYMGQGGRTNYRSALSYIRKVIDGKVIFAPEPGELVEAARGQYYHYDEELGEMRFFDSLADYNEYLEMHNLYSATAPSIIVTGGMGLPRPLMEAFEKSGNNVYGVSSFRSCVEGGAVDTICPSAIINMAHGRLGEFAVDYLKRQDIPLFSPLNVNMMVEKWREDKMGMSGGFLSQSVVMPEIDGALRPYVVFGHYLDENGVPYADAIPQRLEKFVRTVGNYISLKKKDNGEKRVAFVYYKGPGLSALTAGGMDVSLSLYNVLRRMKSEGFGVSLPSSAAELRSMIDAVDYKDSIAPRVMLGNVALLPQLAPAEEGGSSFANVHGAKVDPPASYINEYKWIAEEFKADALIHFGTHGSLEYTPAKQVALSESDWPERLVGELPHFYIYCVDNPGEAIIAKRRSYAGIISHLTPPFMGTGLQGDFHKMKHLIGHYNEKQSEENALRVTALAHKMGMDRDLGLSRDKRIYDDGEICRLENFLEELNNTHITGNLYTMGVAYEADKLKSTVMAMAADPIAYSLATLDKLKGRVDEDVEKHHSLFTARYINPSRRLVSSLLSSGRDVEDEEICRIAGISDRELSDARKWKRQQDEPADMMSMMRKMAAMKKKNGAADSLAHKSPKKKKMSMGDMMKAAADGKMPSMEDMKKMKAAARKHKKEKKVKAKSEMAAMMKMMRPQVSAEDKAVFEAVVAIEQTMKNVSVYRASLLASPELEQASLINALEGGYVSPTPGGDPVASLNTIPTGRNIYGINAEATPTESSWEKGKQLAEGTIEMYRSRHNGEYPRKVSYTLWSSEFVQTEGASVAQILYMLGVEPVRDMFGRVNDIRLISSEKLGRPRIDVVVQTSGQLRDLAASRLFLINRAVEMAAKAKGDKYENMVAEGVTESEKTLVEEGVSPKEAREIASYRVFGASDGGYGTGIQGMVQRGDTWDGRDEIARRYIQNMGAFYGTKEGWESVRKAAFKAALTRTDVVTQPRQSNTWGALSLDHVYEFMGGMNVAVTNVTGKTPDAYLSDYRNRHNARMQELKEAVGVESRTTILNPVFVKERMKGEAESANYFAETVENTYGWNVMRPEAVDKELWDDIHDMLVRDVHHLGVREWMDEKNPAAVQEVTAVMLESVRKGLWKADSKRVAELADVHAESVRKHGLSQGAMDFRNLKLRDYIQTKLPAQKAEMYRDKIEHRDLSKDDKSLVMKKEEIRGASHVESQSGDNALVVVIIAAIFAIVGAVVVVRRRKGGRR